VVIYLNKNNKYIFTNLKMSVVFANRRRPYNRGYGGTGMRNVSYFRPRSPRLLPFRRRTVVRIPKYRMYRNPSIVPFGGEVKHIIWSQPTGSLQFRATDNGWENVWLSNIAIGTGESQRVGSKIKLVDVSFKMSLCDNPESILTEPHVIRVVLWCLKTAMSASTSVHNILLQDSSNYNSLINIYQGQNVIVYYDETFQVNPGYNAANVWANRSLTFNIKEYRKLGFVSNFTTSVAGNSAPTMQLFMSIFSNANSAATGFPVSYQAKLNYTDS